MADWISGEHYVACPSRDTLWLRSDNDFSDKMMSLYFNQLAFIPHICDARCNGLHFEYKTRTLCALPRTMDNVNTGTVCTDLLGERSFGMSVTVLYTLCTFLDTRDTFEQDWDINIGLGTVPRGRNLARKNKSRGINRVGRRRRRKKQRKYILS